jgi:hypothetical protein
VPDVWEIEGFQITGFVVLNIGRLDHQGVSCGVSNKQRRSPVLAPHFQQITHDEPSTRSNTLPLLAVRVVDSLHNPGDLANNLNLICFSQSCSMT